MDWGGIAANVGLWLAKAGWRFLRSPESACRRIENAASIYMSREPMQTRGLGRVDRRDSDEIADLLAKGRSVLVTGEGGTGKSAVALMVAESLRASRHCVLFLKCDALVPGIDTEVRLSQELDLTPSIRQVIREASRRHPVTVILDQLDSVAESPLLPVLCSLARTVEQMENAQVLAVSRAFHAEHSGPIRELGFRNVVVGSLSEQHTRQLLAKLHLDHPADALVSMAANFLNLSLIADLLEQGLGVGDVATDASLWKRYFDAIRTREGERAWDRAVSLAVETHRKGEHQFTLGGTLVCSDQSSAETCCSAPGVSGTGSCTRMCTTFCMRGTPRRGKP